ncbi:hypothetical protein XENOCAPTIV_003940, partial [Xenoophorus captivus]
TIFFTTFRLDSVLFVYLRLVSSSDTFQLMYFSLDMNHYKLVIFELCVSISRSSISFLSPEDFLLSSQLPRYRFLPEQS